MTEEINSDSINNCKRLIEIKCDSNDLYSIYGRPCELSAFSYVPQSRTSESAERSIYNSKKQDLDANRTDYDRLFTVESGFNNKVHRCDRKHAKLLGLDPWSEEIKKSLPSRNSTVYGKSLVKIPPIEAEKEKNIKVKYESNLDPPNRKYTRIAKVQSDFYNRNGINDLTRQKSVLL